MKTGRNEPCPCGSGKKYKRCCGDAARAPQHAAPAAGKFRFESGSYGGPGHGYVPSIICQQRVAEGAWHDHFVLANPTAHHPDPDAATAEAEKDLAEAFAVKHDGGSEAELVMSLKSKGYVNVTGFQVIRDEEETDDDDGPMETAAFIQTESEDDLIVSFAILNGDDPGDVLSLTLIRTPKYEGVLDESERGVHVSFERVAEDEDDFLEAVDFDQQAAKVRLKTTRRRYAVDVRIVESGEIEEMKKLFRLMNFDGRFKITGF